MKKTFNSIEVRGGNVNNLKNINVDIPLDSFVAISGLSGSGKSSLAMGILYSEGSRRYLEALSTYTRRRISQGKRSSVQQVRHIPSAIALRQRPVVPSERSTVGSMSEGFNVVRLVFSRLGSTICPNGHRVSPSLKIAQAMDLPGGPNSQRGMISCPTCGVEFLAKSAEDFSFNAGGACPECHGTGEIRDLDETKLISDENKTLDQGAIASWRLPGRTFMPTVARTLGVRTDVPYKELTDQEKQIVLHGEKKLYPVNFRTSTGRVIKTEKTLYENAYDAVYDSLKTSKSEKAINKINTFFHFSTCPTCHGTRFNPDLLTQLTGGENIVEVSNRTLGELKEWMNQTKKELPKEMQAMANILFQELQDNIQPLLNLGLDYLQLSRNGNTLSTGELQRIQLARTLRSETTGVLYVLDEPSIGLHPDNVKGLIEIFNELIKQGNSLVVVDHDVDIIQEADWIIEVGPGSGVAGGNIIAQGTPKDLTKNPSSLIGPYIDGSASIIQKKSNARKNIELEEGIHFEVENYFNIKSINVTIPMNEITAVTGFSGSGKTSLILDSLVPAIQNLSAGNPLPAQVKELTTKIQNVVSVDAKPVGKNTRSTIATYTTIMDNLRHLFAELPIAKEKKFGIAYFSYNNKEGACPNCGGLGTVSLDIQYLPDMEEVCPVCHGTRFKEEVQEIHWNGYSIVDLLALSVSDSLKVFKDIPKIQKQVQLLDEIGLSYLHLGESTASLSGGEAQRLKLVSHLNKIQAETLFVFDEPSIGLHPLDVHVLLEVMNKLKAQGATIIMITHDLDLMLNADYLIDLGPEGGVNGGRLMASGRPMELINNPKSLTLKYLKEYGEKFNVI
ncbi:ATP-binding cassette domain-containing protein [Enterococcus thailandicus]|uniref:ATP-binding cassette domain-containing protein n=1 Tax=Enterococcus thailandicus TaxID=417368 RepID=UPI0022EC0C47|nr:ATP-binding cassette domain-containing protein [Enterococcus thailandicus]MDA3972695.1 ATP-binding cassette domain-containing protein [Enterococcus thailandicus]MDA3975191.1 ATP-binding cassette domain-containing protein [Enterococcus thailandicus]MDA3980155.1 ATP-binding cassette domain-containing protein [Enterococcus thailandicus]